jgi:hypothetical protein
MLPENLYLELTIGQMSAQETNFFEFPCIGDDLNEKDRAGQPRFTLDLLRQTVEDQCSNPPAFRGVKTPITELLEQDTSKPSRNVPGIANATKTPETKTTKANITPGRMKRKACVSMWIKKALPNAHPTNDLPRYLKV